MKNILILNLFILGCAVGPHPEFPQSLRSHYMVEVRDENTEAKEADNIFISKDITDSIENLEDLPRMSSEQKFRCVLFEIINANPYKIKYIREVELKECNGVGGYKPDDSKLFYNFLKDFYDWAEGRKKCFK